MGVMEGRDAKHIGQRYKDLYKPVLLANWQVWPVTQVGVPLQFLPNLSDEVSVYIVDQLSLYAIAVSCTFSVHMWLVLDSVPLLAQREVRVHELA